MATGSVTQTHEYSNPGQVIIKLQWKAGIATGSISTKRNPNQKIFKRRGDK